MPVNVSDLAQQGSEFEAFAKTCYQLVHYQEIGIRLCLEVDDQSWKDCIRSDDDTLTNDVTHWMRKAVSEFVSEYFPNLTEEEIEAYRSEHEIEDQLPEALTLGYFDKPDKRAFFASKNGRFLFKLSLVQDEINPMLVDYLNYRSGTEMTVGLPSYGQHSTRITIQANIDQGDSQDKEPMVSVTYRCPQGTVAGPISVLCNHADQSHYIADRVSIRISALVLGTQEGQYVSYDPNGLPEYLAAFREKKLSFFDCVQEDPPCSPLKVIFNQDMEYQFLTSRVGEDVVLSSQFRIRYPQRLIEDDGKICPTAIIRNVVVPVKLGKGMSHRNVRSRVTGLGSDFCSWCFNILGLDCSQGCKAHHVCFLCFDYDRKEQNAFDWHDGSHLQLKCKALAPLFQTGYCLPVLPEDKKMADKKPVSAAAMAGSQLSQQALRMAKAFKEQQEAKEKKAAEDKKKKADARKNKRAAGIVPVPSPFRMAPSPARKKVC